MLCVILAGAAGTDFVFGRICNWWLLLGTVIGVWIRGVSFFLEAGVILIPAFFLFRMRMMGAGDGKLMAVIAGYLGISDGIPAIWAGLCLGAVWSLCRIRQGESLRARLDILAAFIVRMIQNRTVTAYEDLSGGSGKHRIPLAVCLAAGVYLFLAYSRLTGRRMG
ncbi:MAG: A24 family peptidase [Lachnospiraceae bacterium]|nr:A24 family peptidase [Lachnospiraceae bacterium]